MADHNKTAFKCRDPQRGNPRCGKPRSEAALEATIADAVEVYSTNLVVVTNVQLVTDQHESIGRSLEKMEEEIIEQIRSTSMPDCWTHDL